MFLHTFHVLRNLYHNVMFYATIGQHENHNSFSSCNHEKQDSGRREDVLSDVAKPIPTR